MDEIYVEIEVKETGQLLDFHTYDDGGGDDQIEDRVKDWCERNGFNFVDVDWNVY